MDVNKYRALFIDESREHVAEMSRLLVELETAKERGPIIDEIFRHAHSIKSMAASMGYEPIATLAHRLEDVVGAVRSSQLALAGPTVDILLRSVDALSQQVKCIAESLPLEGHFELVRELGQVSQQVTQQSAAVGAVGAAKIVPRDSAGAHPLVRVRLVTGCSAPPLRAFLVYRRLSELGSIAKVQPSLEEIKAGQMRGLDVVFAFAQPYDQAAVHAALASVPDVDSILFESAEQAPPADAGSAVARVDSGAERDKAQATLRVRADLLDDILDSVGELFIVRERLRVLLGPDAQAPVRGAMDGLAARIRQIHDQVIAARMTPLRTLTDRYPRLVRDLCRSLGKDVELEVRGRDIEIDRAILDNLDVAFIHTLRNAVDHGIELPVDRLQRGKSAVGKVIITASRDRDNVLVVIEDDGAGIDPVKLREVAIQRGVVTAAAAEVLSLRETFFLICLPGFSTKSEVSDISGRGVGMDVVSARVESVGGALDIDSELGRGTRFVFRLPLTLAIIPVLLVQAAGRIFAMPVAKVIGVRDTAGETLRQPDGSHYLRYNQNLLPLVPLGPLLGLSPPGSPLPPQVVLIEAGAEQYALGVERITGYREVVVKPLGDPLDRLEFFSGATILGDGQPILILDLPKTLRLRVAA